MPTLIGVGLEYAVPARSRWRSCPRVRWLPMETVLVSGGSGYLGGRWVVELLCRGYALGWEPRPIEETIVDCGRSLAR